MDKHERAQQIIREQQQRRNLAALHRLAASLAPKQETVAK